MCTNIFGEVIVKGLGLVRFLYRVVYEQGAPKWQRSQEAVRSELVREDTNRCCVMSEDEII